MILIGLTGGIATGKTSCSRRFIATKGVTLIDCDAVVHELQTKGSEAVRAIKKVFPSVVSDDFVLDRAALGQIIFNDPLQRQKLGSLMNKRIFFAICKKLFSLWFANPRDHIVILDAPTLYESKIFVHLVSSVIVVACSEESQLTRLMKRNSLSREDALARIRAQIPISTKKAMADYVIDNSAEGEPAAHLDKRVADSVEWIRKTQGATKFPLVLAGLSGAVVSAFVASVIGLSFAAALT